MRGFSVGSVSAEGLGDGRVFGGGPREEGRAVFVLLSVVRTTSISVAVLWTGSYLVGVVIVEKRQFSRRKRKKGSVSLSLSRLMLMSPWIVIDVSGLFVRILSIVI